MRKSDEGPLCQRAFRFPGFKTPARWFGPTELFIPASLALRNDDAMANECWNSKSDWSGAHSRSQQMKFLTRNDNERSLLRIPHCNVTARKYRLE
jgi:hypothetical protein